jgi:hypothetical protein
MAHTRNREHGVQGVERMGESSSESKTSTSCVFCCAGEETHVVRGIWGKLKTCGASCSCSGAIGLEERITFSTKMKLFSLP